MFDQLPHEGGHVLPDAVVRIDVATSLLEQGWTKKGDWRANGMRCMGQALLEAYGFGELPNHDSKSCVLANLPLTVIIRVAMRSHYGIDHAIETFNDDAATTGDMVRQVLGTARRWIADGTCGLDVLNMDHECRERLNHRLVELHQIPYHITAMAV